jgi:hypothetical protein
MSKRRRTKQLRRKREAIAPYLAELERAHVPPLVVKQAAKAMMILLAR